MRHGSHLSLIQNTCYASRVLIIPGFRGKGETYGPLTSIWDPSNISLKNPYVLLFHEIRLTSGFTSRTQSLSLAKTSKKNVEFIKAALRAANLVPKERKKFRCNVSRFPNKCVYDLKEYYYINLITNVLLYVGISMQLI